MELFRLFGVISLNNEQAIGAMQETSNTGQKTESRLKKAFGGIGKAASVMGKAVATGVVVGSAAMGKLVTDGMKLAGELEQNMGGSEAVFGMYAKKMQDTALEAYKTMGLSQSEYLATANKMGSLLQGSGFGQEEAASLTIETMQRAADVASIMGIETSAAMEAIAGAAKGNFTMMDNLGVAVNDTILKNYAESKKWTKQQINDMTLQQKTMLAMEYFMEQTSYATGNYAKENDTLAGSLATTKAALQNFLSGAGDADAVVDSLAKSADVIASNLTKLVPKLAKGIPQIIKGLTPKIGGLMQAALPGILEGAVSLLVGLAQALPDLASVLVEQIPVIVSQLAAAAEVALPAIADAIITMFDGIVNNLPAILQSIGKVISSVWGSGIWPMVQGLFKAVFGIELPDWETIKSTISTKAEELYNAASDWMKQTFGIELPAWGSLWQTITEEAKKLFDAAGTFMKQIFSIELPSWNEICTTIATEAENLFNAAGDWMKQTFGIELPSWATIKKTISTKTKELYDAAASWMKQTFGIELPSFEEVASSISTWWTDTMTTVGEVFSKLFSIELPTIDDIVNAISTWWSDITSKISLGLTAVWNGITGGGGDAEDLGNGFTELPSGRVVPTATIDKEANGLDFVSRDQMPAILHYGEAVLNRTDAKAWRDGSGNGGMMALADKMDAMLEVLSSGFSGMGNQQIILDSGALVGSISNGIDSRLGRMHGYKARGI